MKITLIDINQKMTEAWQKEFARYKNVSIVQGSIFDCRADAIISPANSFGIMDGGIDGKLRDFFGLTVESAVRNQISEKYFGELAVGSAIIVPTAHSQFKYLISAPTMRVPEEVSDSLNAYLAMRAILSLCKVEESIKSIAIPGLCALSGRMPFNIVARQMRVAYDKIVEGKIQYSHWREEKELQNYLKCRTEILPYDLESEY